MFGQTSLIGIWKCRLSLCRDILLFFFPFGKPERKKSALNATYLKTAAFYGNFDLQIGFPCPSMADEKSISGFLSVYLNGEPAHLRLGWQAVAQQK